MRLRTDSPLVKSFASAYRTSVTQRLKSVSRRSTCSSVSTNNTLASFPWLHTKPELEVALPEPIFMPIG